HHGPNGPIQFTHPYPPIRRISTECHLMHLVCSDPPYATCINGVTKDDVHESHHVRIDDSDVLGDTDVSEKHTRLLRTHTSDPRYEFSAQFRGSMCLAKEGS